MLWLKYMQQLAQFIRRLLDILAISAIQLRTQLGRDYVLRRQDNKDFISPIKDKLKLCQLVALLDRVVNYYLQTLSITLEQLYYQLKSFYLMNYFLQPFSLLQTSSAQKGYTTLQKYLLYFIFRAQSTLQLLQDVIYSIKFSMA